MSTRIFALCAATLTCSFALANPNAPVASTAPHDPLTASFERLLQPAPAPTRLALPAARTEEVDPLRVHLSARLWAEPSYHQPLRVAQLTTPALRRP